MSANDPITQIEPVRTCLVCSHAVRPTFSGLEFAHDDPGGGEPAGKCDNRGEAYVPAPVATQIGHQVSRAVRELKWESPEDRP